MTAALDRRIGSLFMTGLPGPVAGPADPIIRDIARGGLGGVILFDRCLHDPAQPGNIESAAQLRELTAELQRAAEEPLLIGVDQEGGRVARLGPAHGFPATSSARELGASAAGPAATATAAAATAGLLADLGINLNFAPVVDLDLDPESPAIGAIGRSFGADPDTVTAHAAAWIEAHRTRGVLSCLKHFPGHGSAAADTHAGFVDVSDCWQDLELEPYRRLIAAGLADTVMTGHLCNRRLDPEHPATLSRPTITTLLRGELHYDGPVISDDLQMGAIAARYPVAESVCRAIEAGVDIVLFGNNLAYDPDIFTTAVAAVKDGLARGLVGEQRLFAAIDAVARLKQRLGDSDAA